MKPTGTRTRFILVGMLMALVFASQHNANSTISQNNETSRASTKAGGLVVHEWGTFTSVAGRDGVSVEWRPLDETSDLPSFVYTMEGLGAGRGLRHGILQTKYTLEAFVRMETPVLYFYSDHETAVSVRVDFPEGKITEWYPQARGVYDAGIDWGQINIMPGIEDAFPVEDKPSHYYPARETDAAPLRVCGKAGVQHEKFLFYRGVGCFAVPLAVTFDAERVAIRNLRRERVKQAVLFENHAGRVGYRVCDLRGGVAAFERPELNSSVDALAGELESMLIASGLFEKEARAMLRTWRDSWFEEGLRVFYVVPRAMTDRVLPIQVTPAPEELQRVLVGRIEIVTPEAERAVVDEAASSNEASAASLALREKYGRFVEPIVKRALEQVSDDRLKHRLQQLITRQ